MTMKADHFKLVDYNEIHVESMQVRHIPESVELWIRQYVEVLHIINTLPIKWLNETKSITAFIKKYVTANKGVVALHEGQVLGYIVYDRFSFHGEDTVFIPITGHASTDTGKEIIYKQMYKHLAEHWVNEGVLSHIVCFFPVDESLKELLYQLGFGLYVVDGYRSTDQIPSESDTTIRKATMSDMEDIYRLGEESRSYYSSSPLFLVREIKDKQYYVDLMENEDSATFLSYDEEKASGFIYVRKNRQDDLITLADTNTAMIDEIGAYLSPSVRGQGIGKQLLQHVINWCNDNKIKQIHVDYESTNLYANVFWRKHFTPAIYSVKRKINQDILR